MIKQWLIELDYPYEGREVTGIFTGTEEEVKQYVKSKNGRKCYDCYEYSDINEFQELNELKK